MGRSHDPAGLLVIAPFGEQIRVLQNSYPPPPPPSSPPPPQPPPPSHPSPLTADLPLHLPLPHVKDLCLPHSGQLMRASENTEVGLNEGETSSGGGGWRWEGQKNHGPAAAAAACLMPPFFPRCLCLTNEPQSAPLMKEVINIL